MIKKILKSNYLILAIVCIAVLLLAGCGSQQKTASNASSKGENNSLVTIKFPDTYDPTSLYQPYIAEELGFFKEAGINAVFTGIIPPGQHVAAVVAGTNDVGTLHVNRTISGIQAGAKIKAVVAGSETKKEFPHMTYITLENSPIKTPQDLLGKKIGVIALGGCNEYTPYEFLKKNGIADPKGQITLVQVPVGNEEQALRSGQVDVMGYHGYPKDVFSRGGVRIAFDDYDTWGTVGGATPFYLSEKFIVDNPDATRGFVKAMARAQDWINENPDKAAEIQAKRLKIDKNKVSVMYYAKNGVINEDSVQIWIDILGGYGEIKGNIKAKDVYTNEFNEYDKSK